MIVRILQDRRLTAAVNEVETKTKKGFLEIISVILTHLDEILLVINDPAALVALIIRLLGS